ncbi:hypothetical protein ACFL5O_06840 [Myxococcota bacterium]
MQIPSRGQDRILVKEPSDQKLMLLYDGELSPSEELRIRDRLPENRRSRQVLSGLEAVGDAVRAWGEVRGRAGDVIADRVMSTIQASPKPRRKRTWATTAAGSLALAAGIALAVARLGSTELQSGWRTPLLSSSPQPLASQSANQRPSQRREETNAAIELVDFGSRTGTIFMVAAGPNVTTPVVWLVDEPSTQRASPESL